MNTHFKTFIFYSIVFRHFSNPLVFEQQLLNFHQQFYFFYFEIIAVLSSIPIPTWVEILLKLKVVCCTYSVSGNVGR
jgi:hypothetical protein